MLQHQFLFGVSWDLLLIRLMVYDVLIYEVVFRQRIGVSCCLLFYPFEG